MWSPRPRRRTAVASKLLAVLLGLVLGLSLIAAGSRPELTADCASLAAAGGDQAHSQHTPGQPPSRLFDAELQNDGGDDDRADGIEFADWASQALELRGIGGRWITVVERRNHAAQWARQGHGARGPPIA